MVGLSPKLPLYISPATAMDVNLYAFKKRGGKLGRRDLKTRKKGPGLPLECL